MTDEVSCRRPPAGWRCTREPGHDGPCAAVAHLLPTPRAQEIAQAFHETYEALAPAHGYETREASRTAWESVPAENKSLMVAVAQSLLDAGTIA